MSETSVTDLPSLTNVSGVAAPGERFNFAEHLLLRNIHRAAKTAFIDDHDALSSSPPRSGRARRIGVVPLPDPSLRERRTAPLRPPVPGGSSR